MTYFIYCLAGIGAIRVVAVLYKAFRDAYVTYSEEKNLRTVLGTVSENKQDLLNRIKDKRALDRVPDCTLGSVVPAQRCQCPCSVRYDDLPPA